jgi:hypothetical protein
MNKGPYVPQLERCIAMIGKTFTAQDWAKQFNRGFVPCSVELGILRGHGVLELIAASKNKYFVYKVAKSENEILDIIDKLKHDEVLRLLILKDRRAINKKVIPMPPATGYQHKKLNVAALAALNDPFGGAART